MAHDLALSVGARVHLGEAYVLTSGWQRSGEDRLIVGDSAAKIDSLKL